MARISRREWLLLGGAIAAGWGASLVLRETVPVGREVADNPNAREILAAGGAPGITPADPDLTMLVFTDYQCPICRVSETEMNAAAAGDGRVRLSYREWPVFGPVSERAAQVALAAVGQGIYPALHRLLMAEARRLDDDVLQEAVTSAGGDWARLESDLAANRAAITQTLTRNSRDALALGLAGTPGYLIGGLLVEGAQTERGFRRAFDRARRLAARQSENA
jgi:protein-disulfide isomerase